MTTSAVLVTGASSGIGRAIALRLATAGHHVIVHSHTNQEGGEVTLAGIVERGGSGSHVCADLTSDAAVEDLFGTLSSKGVMLGGLVNNAGRTEPTQFRTMGSDHWIEQLEVNFLSAVRCSRSAVELLKGSPSPWIINIASIRGLTYATRSGVMAYSAAKAALISFTKSLAQELAPTVRVNAIAPGVTETPYLERVEPELVEKWRRDTLLGHLVLPDQVAEALIYLADAQSVTGEVLVVDGGTSSSSR